MRKLNEAHRVNEIPKALRVSKGQDKTWAHITHIHIYVSLKVKRLFMLEERESTGGGNQAHGMYHTIQTVQEKELINLSSSQYLLNY